MSIPIERQIRRVQLMLLNDESACVSMLPRSGFASRATIFTNDEIITNPPPDCSLDFVPSVAMLIGVSS